jgi:hypothetical protein
MASTDLSLLRARARRSYELSRVQLGLRSAAWVLPLIALSFVTLGKPALTCSVGALLLIATTWLRFQGGVFGSAITPGLLAGSAPLILPLLMRGSDHCCIGGACLPICMLACIAGGAIAGIGIGVASASLATHRVTFLLTAGALATLTGMLGCAVVGAAGTAAMAVAVAVACGPTVVLASARAGTRG